MLFAFGCHGTKDAKEEYSKIKLLFEDSGVQDWHEKWMMDGLRSKVVNTDSGMELIAGPEHGNDSCHVVLWTKQSFKGDICIEYDYTRTDTTTRCVNILYFLATGEGNAQYPNDISLWNDKRTVPHMSTYFNHMNTYHISYAAFAANVYSGDKDYIRMRRYIPGNKGLKSTDIPGDHFRTGLFKPFITYHIEVYKFHDQVKMSITNKEKSKEQLICKWDISKVPPCNSGRIGFRQMYTRSARYKNIKVWQLK